jgi:hypothetical protein
VRLEISGYTDLSGRAAYNERLSDRRANAVADVPRATGRAAQRHGGERPRHWQPAHSDGAWCASRRIGASRWRPDFRFLWNREGLRTVGSASGED